MRYLLYWLLGDLRNDKLYNDFFNQYLSRIRKIAESCETPEQIKCFIQWITNLQDFCDLKLSQIKFSSYFAYIKYYAKMTQYLEDCKTIAKNKY